MLATQSGFTLSAEVIPPRNGSEQRIVMDQIKGLIDSGAAFLSVTKGAGGSLRGGSLPIAQAVKERFGVPCIAHFTCRDLTAAEVENLLMDHHYFGIRNILALRGDPPDGQPNWEPRPGGHRFAYELIAQIRELNQGRYLQRANGPAAEGSIERTDFCIGAAVYPEHPNEGERIEFFKRKVEAGAEYGITDMLFEPESYARFLDLCGKQGLAKIPILPGTRILKTRAQAERMAAKFRVNVPKKLLASLSERDGPDALERGIDLFIGLVEKLRSYGAPGIHLFVIVDQLAASTALARLRSMGYGSKPV
ncbi:MAG: methylenetetrahydrofolate reductase [Oligoflexia bacterium]|nr:methylenetetrahydrofolate reductase [Oligoflexia bacterium]